MIVIGGSNGGVNAILAIVKVLPAKLIVPMGLVLHLSKRYSSSLAQVIDYHSKFPVTEAEDKEMIKPGRLYVSPPNYHLMIERDGRIAYDASELVNYSRPSIDVFFETAALAFGPDLVGILLTGANNDGAVGLHEVHRQGGYTIVQNPLNAKSPEMPSSALALFTPDEILDLPEIAARIIQLGY